MSRDHIETFGSWFRDRSGLSRADVAARSPDGNGDTTPADGSVDLSIPVLARIEHSRWIARCPLCTGGAELVDPEDPLFYCHSGCKNAAVGNAYIRVKFPRERRKIEALLLLRTADETRNWTPGETLAALRAENAAHGIE